MNTTSDQLEEAVGCAEGVISEWAYPLQVAMNHWEISTAERMAGFLAQCSHESACFSVFQENLNYSAQGLANTWPGRYAVDPRSSVKMPNPLALRLHRQPEFIANYTYAGRMGNSPDPEDGDGWKYIGRGPIQVTGKTNYNLAGAALGVDLEGSPELVLKPEYGAHAAAWFWYTNGCNEMMDDGDFRAVTKTINGGLIGLDKRIIAWDCAKSALGLA